MMLAASCGYTILNFRTNEKRQFTLAQGLLYVTTIGLLLGILGACDRSSTAGSLVIFIAIRVLGMVVVAGVVGIFTGSFWKCMIGAFLGVLMGDLAWIVVCLGMGASISLNSMSSNPLVGIGLITCSCATAPNRTRVLGVGFLLSWFLPIVVLIWGMVDLSIEAENSNTQGLGLAGVVLFILSLVAIFTGCIGAIITRSLFEIVERRFIRNNQSDQANEVQTPGDVE